MKNRKRLAVLPANVVYKAYQHSLLEGIFRQAYALDYDVVVISPFMSFEDNLAHQIGEYGIYHMIDFSQFDAVLYAPCTFFNNESRKIVEDIMAERCHIPIIALEHYDERYHCIPMDDASAFERVTDHLIEVHHVKKIYCLTGFQDNEQAEMRQQGYRNSMQKHGLPVEDGWVIYGDFWTMAAQALAEQLASGEVEMPEAIVCCCDSVSIALSNRLIELGIRVPEDILVASYDRGEEAEDNVPSITTYVRPVQDLGIRGVLKAHELITGERVEPVYRDYGYLVTAQSCGCGADFHLKFTQRQKEIREDIETRRLFDRTPMAEWLNACETLNDLLHGIANFFYLVEGLQDWYLCLCDQWDDLSKATANTEDYNTYTPTMHLRLSCTDQVAKTMDVPFPLSDMFPALHADREQPRAYYVTPVHFNERCLGYSVLGYGAGSFKAFDSVYHSWIRNVNNALEFIRIRNNFNSMNQRLFISSIRDTLTGIYNRTGYAHFAGDLFEKAKASAPEKKLLILAADLDCLKVINDNYGHLEGDLAISAVANALNTCFSYGEICARTGGDEFLVIGCADYSEKIIAHYIDYIQRFLARFNAESGKPYEVGVSLGYYCDTVKPEDTLQNLTDIADTRMYANKAERKKGR